jgi:hypothetical protein
MPRNGISGDYKLPTGINPVIPGTIIDADWANQSLTDVATAITLSLPRDGQAPMTGTLKLADGSVSAPGIAWNSDSTTGLFRPLTNTLGFTAGGIEQGRFTGGNLLLGSTSDTGDKLQVTGSTRLNGATKIVTGGLTVDAGGIKSLTGVEANGANGFSLTSVVANARNPIWKFGSADAIGMSYFAGTSGVDGTDSIGIHFGTATSTGSLWSFNTGGHFTATGAITGAAFSSYGNSFHNGDSRSIYGANTLGGMLYVGGNGYTGLTRTNQIASMSTTAGELLLDAGTNKKTLINYSSGTGGVVFGNGAGAEVASVSSTGVVTASNFVGPLAGTATKASTLASGGTADGGPLVFHSADTTGTPSWLWGSNGGTDSRLYRSGGLRVGVANNADNAAYAATVANNNSNDGGTYNIAWFSGNTLYTTAPISLTPALGRINANLLNGKLSDAALGSNSWVGVQEFPSNYDTTHGQNAALQAISTNAGGAVMAFHRKGVYAVNMGLDSDNQFRIGGWSAAGSRLTMDMAGNLTMAGNIAAYSDERLKKEVVVIEDALKKVRALRGVNFTRIEDGARCTGVIAQEVRNVLPEAVREDKEGMLSVAYGNMVGLLIEATKTLAAKVEFLQGQVKRLEDATL